MTSWCLFVCLFVADPQTESTCGGTCFCCCSTVSKVRHVWKCDVSETDSPSYTFILRVKINKKKELYLSTYKSECFLILEMWLHVFYIHLLLFIYGYLTYMSFLYLNTYFLIFIPFYKPDKIFKMYSCCLFPDHIQHYHQLLLKENMFDYFHSKIINLNVKSGCFFLESLQHHNNHIS